MGRETMSAPGRPWYCSLAAWGAAVVLAGLTCGAMAEGSRLAQKAPEAAELLAAAQRQGYVRVIVQFEGPAAQVRPDPASIAETRAQVAAMQDAIIASHVATAVGFDRAITRFEITPAFAANATAAELESLAADPRVKTLNSDRAVPPAPAPPAAPPDGR